MTGGLNLKFRVPTRASPQWKYCFDRGNTFADRARQLLVSYLIAKKLGESRVDRAPIV
ncbi:hypothetical protein IQ235_06505 [Oscillatoriales cyanobacterium LEGE 11467]|uniref:Uncharacterized protein n=1 Tax=Zarconia navalis LEGE 11467 TaxID=1828826 RepID=A0A928VVT5_9CYAN|nr:hypothetical protein [Zarconia navalis]MBE9040439.1 hypothetical protein [Zarconia navalis LEGE 11467]